MFQAPQITPRTPRITKPIHTPHAEKPRAMKPDPVIAMVAEVIRTRKAFLAARKSLDAFRRKRDPKELEAPTVHLPGNTIALVALSTKEHDIRLRSEPHIDGWAKKHRQHYRAIIRGTYRGKAFRVSKDRAREYLAHIDALVPVLKSTLAKKQEEATKRWREIGFTELKDRDDDAAMTFWTARNKVVDKKPKTVAGAYALLELLEHFAKGADADEHVLSDLPYHCQATITRNVLTALRSLNK